MLTFENFIGAVDETLKTMMCDRNELKKRVNELILRSIPYNRNWKDSRAYVNRVKEIAHKKKDGKSHRGTASRFIKNALWEPNSKHASKVTNKGIN